MLGLRKEFFFGWTNAAWTTVIAHATSIVMPTLTICFVFSFPLCVSVFFFFFSPPLQVRLRQYCQHLTSCCFVSVVCLCFGAGFDFGSEAQTSTPDDSGGFDFGADDTATPDELSDCTEDGAPGQTDADGNPCEESPERSCSSVSSWPSSLGLLAVLPLLLVRRRLHSPQPRRSVRSGD